MTEWQPIETAPKDGTPVLLCSTENEQYRVFCPCEWIKAGEISEDGFWLWWQAGPAYLVEVSSPAHWMPLPTPPKDTP